MHHGFVLASPSSTRLTAHCSWFKTPEHSRPERCERISRPPDPEDPSTMNRLAAPFASQATFSSSTLDFSSGFAATSLSPPAPRGAHARRRIREAAPGVALFSPIHYERRYAYPLV